MTSPAMKDLLVADGNPQNHDFILDIGCGMGVKRPVKFITGDKSWLECIAYPRICIRC